MIPSFYNDNQYQNKEVVFLLEDYLINHCSPTLAGCKIGSLFTYRNNERKEINTYLIEWNKKLYGLGIFITVLRKRKNSSLIYVYNKFNLEKLLKEEEVFSYLFSLGYLNDNVDEVLLHLKKKLSDNKNVFPHEIGIFLGYPLCDVIGFIENKGKSYKNCGKWKVYGCKRESQILFDKYDYCKNCYKKMHSKGYDILEIIEKYKGEII